MGNLYEEQLFIKLTGNDHFQRGVEAGIKQMMNHIQRQSSKNKPVEANGELYWLTDSRQHLIDIMNDINKTVGQI